MPKGWFSGLVDFQRVLVIVKVVIESWDLRERDAELPPIGDGLGDL